MDALNSHLSDAKSADRGSVEWLVDFAQARFKVPGEALRSLRRDPAASPHDLVQLALRRGIIDALQADVLSTLLSPHETLPDHEFLDFLGRGAMGVVYRAVQKSLDRTVAVKTLQLDQSSRTTGIARFELEAKTIARLMHPHIVGAYNLFRQSGRLYLVMEYLQGETLDRFL